MRDKEEFPPLVLPLSFTSDAQTRILDFTLHRTPLTSTLYRLSIDDCLQAFAVNGRPTPGLTLPLCEYSRSIAVDLGEVLLNGPNLVHVELRNAGGPARFALDPSPLDPRRLILVVLALLVVASWGTVFLRHPRVRTWRSLALAVMLGVVLRMVYVLGTGPTVRSHDLDGHLEYIRFLLDHGRMPLRGEAWEWYQPPLYYLVLSPIGLLGRSFALTTQQVEWIYQLTALLASIAVLLLGAWAIHRVFAAKQRSSAALAIGCLATLPGVVFFASRINNDVAAHLAGFAAAAMLVMWWQRPTQGMLLGITLALAAGILSKANVALLVPAVLASVALHPKVSRKTKLRWGGLLLVTIALLTGWFFYLRFVLQSQGSLIGNVDALNSALRIETNAGTMLTFSPADVLAHPFNNPWDDASRRAFFWEYFYRSAFFGEFGFAGGAAVLALPVLLGSFLLLPALGIGLILALQRIREQLPLVLLFGTLLLGHVILWLRYPYSSSQDFRYSVLLALPIAIFVAQGIDWCPTVLRRTWMGLALLTVLTWGAFVAAAAFS